jgi:hypothetical protein
MDFDRFYSDEITALFISDFRQMVIKRVLSSYSSAALTNKQNTWILLDMNRFWKLVLCHVLQLWNTHHRPGIVVDTCKKSLSNLGLDYVDLYLIHWPFGFQVTLILNDKIRNTITHLYIHKLKATVSIQLRVTVTTNYQALTYCIN